MAAAKITIVKQFVYRDLPEEFSNTYHLSGTAPTTRAAWLTTVQALMTAEKPATGIAVMFLKAYCYDSGATVATQVVSGTDVAALGTYGTMSSGDPQVSGDVAATMRWWTGRYTSKGKKIYLRKYFHGVYRDSGDVDKLHLSQATAYNTFGAALISGSGPIVLGDKDGNPCVAGSQACSPWLTTRTLKRRGKRPPTT